MRHTISANRKVLTIEFTRHEVDALREYRSEHGSIQSDAAMFEAFEPLVCNSELEWIDPAETGDLTSAPMLGIRDENQKVIERWAFMDYAIRSPLETLLDCGKVEFTC